MLGCLGDFMILSAILDYEFSLIYDIWGYVLKPLWMPWWPERNWRILFVPLNYDASMTRNELTDIICPIKIIKCWMLRWFYDLECNCRLWIVTHIWYMSLSFEILMMHLWPERNWRMTDIICPIKFCKCWDASVILWSWLQF